MTRNSSLARQKDAPSQSAPRVGSVASTIAILRFLASVSQPMGVNAIARRLKLTPSSCFNILKTLVAEDFVEIDPETKAYSLGSGIVAIARRALDPNGAFELIRLRAEDLAAQLSLTVGLWRVGRSHIVLVGFVAGAPSVNIHMSVGHRLPLLIGATGRVIAARSSLSDAEIEAEFAKLRWQEPVSLQEYRAQVEHAKRHGWGLDEGRFIRGLTSIAIPISGSRDAIPYCLSVSMFRDQYPPSRFDSIARQMREIADWAAPRLSTPPTGPQDEPSPGTSTSN